MILIKKSREGSRHSFHFSQCIHRVDGVAVIVPERGVHSDGTVHGIAYEDHVLVDETSVYVERVLHSDVYPGVDADILANFEDEYAVPAPQEGLFPVGCELLESQKVAVESPPSVEGGYGNRTGGQTFRQSFVRVSEISSAGVSEWNGW